jgi:threonine dehydrogenase-like Zn-dependent dehydrogenase
MSPSKTTTNSALQVCGVGKVAIEEAPIDLSSPLPAGHVLLRTRATGICGSDVCLALHYIN